MRSRVPFWNFTWWNMCHPYSNLMELQIPIQTYICPSRTPFLACLFDNMFVCPFVCFLSFVSLLSLFLVCWLYVFFFVACTCLERGGATSKMQAKKSKMQAKRRKPKRAMFSRLWGLASPRGYLFLSLSLCSLEPCI